MRRRGAFWTRARILAAIDDFHQQTGRLPTPGAWSSRYGLPSRWTLVRRFGSVAAALQNNEE